jgi:hypothetical protein
MSRSSKLFLLLMVFNQKFLRISRLPNECYMTPKPHPPWPDMRRSPASYQFKHFRSKYYLQHPVLNLTQSSSPNVRDQITRENKSKWQNYIRIFLSLYFLIDKKPKYSERSATKLSPNLISWLQFWFLTVVPKCLILHLSRPYYVPNSIGMSPSWEAASCAPAQEFPNILWNPKVH